jgi:hypothetical protein
MQYIIKRVSNIAKNNKQCTFIYANDSKAIKATQQTAETLAMYGSLDDKSTLEIYRDNVLIKSIEVVFHDFY